MRPAAITDILLGWRWGLLAVLAICLCRDHDVRAADVPPVAQEYDLKAAFLFNLTKFVRWPATKFQQPDSPLVIGIRGDEALERFARVLDGKAIDKHKITVQKLEGIEDLKGCHVAFISRAEKGRLADWTQVGSGAGVLMVGETSQFLDQGGMIQFSVESEQLRLEINDQCARRAGVEIMANALSTLIGKGIAKVRDF